MNNIAKHPFGSLVTHGKNGLDAIAVAVVDGFEFTAIDGDQIFSKQSQLLTPYNELATDAPEGLAVVFSEVSDGAPKKV